MDPEVHTKRRYDVNCGDDCIRKCPDLLDGHTEVCGFKKKALFCPQPPPPILQPPASSLYIGICLFAMSTESCTTAESMCCMPETNITLYISYTSIKKNRTLKKKKKTTLCIVLATFSQVENWFKKTLKNLLNLIQVCMPTQINSQTPTVSTQT